MKAQGSNTWATLPFSCISGCFGQKTHSPCVSRCGEWRRAWDLFAHFEKGAATRGAFAAVGVTLAQDALKAALRGPAPAALCRRIRRLGREVLGREPLS